MASKTEALSIDYKTLSAIPPSRRRQMEREGMFEQAMNILTPGQIAALFPQYYKDDLNSLAGQKSEFSKALTSGYTSNTSSSTNTSSPNATPVKTEAQKKADVVQTRKDMAKKNAVSPSDFRKAESNPLLAGYLGRSKNADAFVGNGKYKTKETASDKQKAIVREANRLGVNPLDLATLISYETGGKYSTDIMGGKGGQYKGLIQFGPAEQQKYLKEGMSFDEQMTAAGNFLEDRGLKKWLADHPNASLEEKRIAMYSTVNAGNPNENNWNKSDNGGQDTVITHTQKMFQEGKQGSTHLGNAVAFMGNSFEEESTNATPVKEQNPLDEGTINNVLDSATPVSQDKVAGADTILDYSKVHENQEGAKVRKGDLQQNVKDSLAYAASKNNVEVDVVSGGQTSDHDPRTKGVEWTGSHRHDDGGAGDLKLYVKDADGNKRYLNMNNPEDKAIMKQFTVDAVASGMTGVGAGDGYMGPETLHIGGGKETHWGGADWIGDALEQGKANRFDLQAWKEEQAAKREEAKKKAAAYKPDQTVSNANDLIQANDPAKDQAPVNPVLNIQQVTPAKDLQSTINDGANDLSNRSDVVKVPIKSDAEIKAQNSKVVENKAEPVKVEETAAKAPEVVQKEIMDNIKESVPSLATPHTETSQASGGVLTEPHTAINNRTGDIVNLGEKGTGGEMIIPRNKVAADELGKSSYNEDNEQRRVPSEEKAGNKVPANIIQVNSPSQNQSQATEVSSIPINHPRRNGSLLKAYARASMQPQINQEGYMNYGHPLF